MPELNFLIIIGMVLIILGLFLMVFWVIARSVQQGVEPSEKKEEKVKGGGAILIGPIPIVFGTDKRFALIAMLLAIVLMLLAIWFLR